MNRRSQKVISGGIAASMLVFAVASANAQAGARTGAWTYGAAPGEWVMPGYDYGLSRFSPLKQITTANVATLKAAWSFSTGTLRGHEGNPLVIGNVMYVHTSFPNKVYALDLSKPGAPIIWQLTPNQSPDAIPIACCDLVNRGTAYHKSGKIFIELLQGELLAIDAKTGKELWRAKHPDKSNAGVEANGYKQGATMTNAPIVIKDMVIAGISGGEFGVRGRVTAFDVNTGKQIWTKYSTGPDDEVGIVNGVGNANYASHKGKDLGVTTWQGNEWKIGGGTTWGWYTYDPELDLFYYSSGNPGSWNPDQRPGDNKWSMTIFARHPADGSVAWAYQMTPHDEWDYDGINEKILFDKGGQKLLQHFDRNGFAYTLDRTNGKVTEGRALRPGQLGDQGRPGDWHPAEGPAVWHHREEEHRGHLPGRDRLQGPAACCVLADDRPVLRPHEPHLHGLRGRRGEVHGRSAVRRRDRPHVPWPGRVPRPVHRLGSDGRQGPRSIHRVGDQGAARSLRWRADHRRRHRLLRHDGRLAQGCRSEDRQGPLAVQDPVGHHRQPDDLHCA